MELVKKYQNLHPILKFSINGVLLFCLWWIFYNFLRNVSVIHEIYEEITAKLTRYLLILSNYFLNFLGFDSYFFGKTIRITGAGGVFLDRGCLGRNLMALFAGFIIAYPGYIKKKLWYIPLGFGIITMINVFRISALAYIMLCCPEHIDINHHVIFKYTVYACIFLMWYIWIQRVNIISKKVSA